MKDGECEKIALKPSTIALDGERTISLNSDENVTVTLTSQGPFVVDVEKTLTAVSETGYLRSHDFGDQFDTSEDKNINGI